MGGLCIVIFILYAVKAINFCGLCYFFFIVIAFFFKVIIKIYSFSETNEVQTTPLLLVSDAIYVCVWLFAHCQPVLFILRARRIKMCLFRLLSV